MQISKTRWIGALIILILALGGWWYAVGKAPAPTVSTAPATATSSEASAQPSSVASSTAPAVAYTGPFPINAADGAIVWTFKGAYAGNDTLIAQANADITKLTGLAGKGQYDDYDIYDGIANDYASLGDGKTAYEYYDRSIKIHPKKGLAYVNLGHLFDVLGAKRTAADAYAKAVAVEPGMLEYHVERLDYLTGQFPKETALITVAFADAAKQFGDTAPILTIEAKWLTTEGRYADAIKAWQTVKTLSPGSDTSSIDAEIARLQAKE